MKKIIPKLSSHYIPATFLFIVLILFISCGKKSSGDGANDPSNNVNYAGTFMRSDSTTTSAGGTFTGVFNKTTLQMTYSFTWHSLTSQPIAMHFHDNGPVIITITGFPVATGQTMSGTATFSTTQSDDLEGGRIFVMIHTTNYPGGEIMAPIVKQ
jgi:hypothetical protein